MKTFRNFVPFFISITLIFLGIFGALQQNIRSTANDPQVALAEDAASYIETGAPLAAFAQETKTDIRKSLSPFIIIYNIKGNIVLSTAILDGSDVKIPKGVLDYAGEHGENRVTWEPASGVRVASVVVKIDKSPNEAAYVVAGRSLREVEKRIHDIELKLLIGWIGTLFLTLASVWLVRRREDRGFTS